MKLKVLYGRILFIPSPEAEYWASNLLGHTLGTITLSLLGIQAMPFFSSVTRLLGRSRVSEIIVLIATIKLPGNNFLASYFLEKS